MHSKIQSVLLALTQFLCSIAITSDTLLSSKLVILKWNCSTVN